MFIVTKVGITFKKKKIKQKTYSYKCVETTHLFAVNALDCIAQRTQTDNIHVTESIYKPKQLKTQNITGHLYCTSF